MGLKAALLAADRSEAKPEESLTRFHASDDNMQPDLFAVNKKFIRSYEKRFYCGEKLVGAIIIGNLARMQELKEQILGIAPREV